MDNKVRTTLVAATVAAAMTSTALTATDLQRTNKALPRFDYNLAMSSQVKAPANGLRGTGSLAAHNIKSPGQSQIVRSKSVILIICWVFLPLVGLRTTTLLLFRHSPTISKTVNLPLPNQCVILLHLMH